RPAPELPERDEGRPQEPEVRDPAHDDQVGTTQGDAFRLLVVLDVGIVEAEEPRTTFTQGTDLRPHPGRRRAPRGRAAGRLDGGAVQLASALAQAERLEAGRSGAEGWSEDNVRSSSQPVLEPGLGLERGIEELTQDLPQPLPRARIQRIGGNADAPARTPR